MAHAANIEKVIAWCMEAPDNEHELMDWENCFFGTFNKENNNFLFRPNDWSQDKAKITRRWLDISKDDFHMLNLPDGYGEFKDWRTKKIPRKHLQRHLVQLLNGDPLRRHDLY